jgi:glycosyltransferase involved in cell wall biosynthesis
MRILWSANALWATTGYGVQGRSLLPRLQRLGHTVANHAWYGLAGGTMEAGDIRIYPAAFEPYGADIISHWVADFQADLVISLIDNWVLPQDFVQRCRPALWASWFPVDQQPCPPMVARISRTADYPITYSQFGQDEALDAGITNCRYIPHGVETGVFKPGDKAEARRRLGVPEDRYLVSMVAANKGFPSRKAFPENLEAFARFRKRHPEALLYLHTLASQANQGLDMFELLAALEIPQDAVFFVNQPKSILGLPPEYMARIYQASDCLLAASQGEGFGIPLVEAQACSCPVISTDWSSMTELTVNGIATEPLQRSWTQLGGWMCVPGVDAIEDALERIYAWRPDERTENGELGVAFVRENYDWDVCVQTYWAPFLFQVEKDIHAGNRQAGPVEAGSAVTVGA